MARISVARQKELLRENRREASFVFRYGAGVPAAQRQAADEQRAKDRARLREIGRLRRARAGS